MSEVKYAIAILKEKLANADRHNLAYQRLSIAEMEAILGTLEKSDKDCATLKSERDALAALAEERRQFIVNGVEMGDILLPVIDGGPAIGIHERCLLKPKFAYDAYLNSVRAEGVEMLAANHQRIVDTLNGDSLFGDGERRHEAIAAAAVHFAAQLRAGKDGE